VFGFVGPAGTGDVGIYDVGIASESRVGSVATHLLHARQRDAAVHAELPGLHVPRLRSL